MKTRKRTSEAERARDACCAEQASGCMSSEGRSIGFETESRLSNSVYQIKTHFPEMKVVSEELHDFNHEVNLRIYSEKIG